MKKKISAAIVLFFAIALFIVVYICQDSYQVKKYEATFLDVFDTMTEMIGYAENKEEFEEQAALLQEKLQYYHELYDIYHSYDGMNNLKTINDQAGITPVEVDQEIINMLLLGREMYEKSHGKINIAYGSVLEVWHSYRERGIDDPEQAKLPPMEILEEKQLHTDISKLIIDEEASTVYLADPDMSLDVGGVAKGYAVQRTAEYAKELGIKNMLLSVGGNVSAIGTRADGTKWRLGIQNPDIESNNPYIAKVDLENQCVVTSGNYQRYYEVEGVRYCHIINPDTRMPADYFASVSVVTEDSGVADALSTILYNMDYQEGSAYVESLEGVEAMWIFGDKSIQYSSGFGQYLVLYGIAEKEKQWLIEI